MAPARKPGAKGTTKVTFTLPKHVTAESAAVCGDFNEWDPDANPMRRYKDGHFGVSINLTEGSYRYRFLLDGEKWENDWDAEEYAPNPYGGEDSIVKV